MASPAQFPDGALIGKAAVITDSGATQATIRLDGDVGELRIRDLQGADACLINRGGNLFLGRLGAPGNAGAVVLYNESGIASVTLRGQSGAYADVGLGSAGCAGIVFVRNDAGRTSIIVDGQKGDITFENADCAEDFDLGVDGDVEPGTVVTLDDEGRVKPCTEPYDTRVVGVVSGGRGQRAAVTLGRKACGQRRVPVGLVGTVYCKATSSSGAISFGDLLTTSPVRGHAMRAEEVVGRQGAIIGKALEPLRSGAALIRMLVMLR
jgi:hypothetical protein